MFKISNNSIWLLKEWLMKFNEWIFIYHFPSLLFTWNLIKIHSYLISTSHNISFDKFTQPTLILIVIPIITSPHVIHPTILTPIPAKPSNTSLILISFLLPSSILIIFSNFNKKHYFQQFHLHLHHLSYSNLFQIFLFQSKCLLFL